VVQLGDKGKVTALMTAESIIAGLLLAYAPVVNERVVSLKNATPPQPVFSTVLAGLLIYGLVLTAFRSLLLLFESIRTGDPCERNYNAGYDLFLMVIIGSGAYALMNAVSVVHYAIIGSNVTVPCEPVFTSELPSIIVAGILTVGLVMLFVFFPLQLTEAARRVRSKRSPWLLRCFLVLAVGTTILAVINGFQGAVLLGWRWCSSLVFSLPAPFGLLTIVALWMLMIPESCYADLGSNGPVGED